MEDPSSAYEDMLFFERRLTEVISGMQPKVRNWRIVLFVLLMSTAYTAYYWICDPDLESISLRESLAKHPFFTANLTFLMVLLLFFGVHKRVVAPKIIAQRCRYVLGDFCLSCDEHGKLIVRPAYPCSPLPSSSAQQQQHPSSQSAMMTTTTTSSFVPSAGAAHHSSNMSSSSSSPSPLRPSQSSLTAQQQRQQQSQSSSSFSISNCNKTVSCSSASPSSSSSIVNASRHTPSLYGGPTPVANSSASTKFDLIEEEALQLFGGSASSPMRID